MCVCVCVCVCVNTTRNPSACIYVSTFSFSFKFFRFSRCCQFPNLMALHRPFAWYACLKTLSLCYLYVCAAAFTSILYQASYISHYKIICTNPDGGRGGERERERVEGGVESRTPSVRNAATPVCRSLAATVLRTAGSATSPWGVLTSGAR